MNTTNVSLNICTKTIRRFEQLTIAYHSRNHSFRKILITNLLAKQRPATSEEIARALFFNFTPIKTTGQTLIIDGGLTSVSQTLNYLATNSYFITTAERLIVNASLILQPLFLPIKFHKPSGTFLVVQLHY